MDTKEHLWQLSLEQNMLKRVFVSICRRVLIYEM